MRTNKKYSLLVSCDMVEMWYWSVFKINKLDIQAVWYDKTKYIGGYY